MWMLLFAQLQPKIEDNVAKINPNVSLNTMKYCCFSIINHYILAPLATCFLNTDNKKDNEQKTYLKIYINISKDMCKICQIR